MFMTEPAVQVVAAIMVAGVAVLSAALVLGQVEEGIEQAEAFDFPEENGSVVRQVNSAPNSDGEITDPAEWEQLRRTAAINEAMASDAMAAAFEGDMPGMPPVSLH